VCICACAARPHPFLAILSAVFSRLSISRVLSQPIGSTLACGLPQTGKVTAGHGHQLEQFHTDRPRRGNVAGKRSILWLSRRDVEVKTSSYFVVYELAGIIRVVTGYQEQSLELKRLDTGSGHLRISRPLTFVIDGFGKGQRF
jgi:hypothetical protein